MIKAKPWLELLASTDFNVVSLLINNMIVVDMLLLYSFLIDLFVLFYPSTCSNDNNVFDVSTDDNISLPIQYINVCLYSLSL